MVRVMDWIRRVVMRVGWRPAAAIGLILLGLTAISHILLRQHPRNQPSAAHSKHHQGEPSAAPEAAALPEGRKQVPLGPDDEIVRAHSPDGEQMLLRTFSLPDAEDGIRCVDAVDGRVKWQRPSVCGGRYTYLHAGEFTLVECTGFPQENTLAVRRLSDGHVLGRPWTLGRLYDFAISGRRVVTVEPIVIIHGQEIPVTSMGETPDGLEATRVRVYDEWGHVRSSRHVPDGARLTGFPRGFAVVSDAATILLTSSGRRVASLR